MKIIIICLLATAGTILENASIAQDNHVMKKNKLTNATTMLIVSDVKRSAEFYRDKLGFKIDFIFEPGPNMMTPFASVSRDRLKVYLESYDKYEEDYRGFEKVAVKAGVYFMVEDVDALYEEFVGRGSEPLWAPHDQSYGNRDFKLLDPDGHQLLFATEIEQ